RGARLIVVDPRRVGVGRKAGIWLRGGPGSDAALAVGVGNLMMEGGWDERAVVGGRVTGAPVGRGGKGGTVGVARVVAGASAGGVVVEGGVVGGGRRGG